MTASKVEQVQRACNRFTNKYLLGVAPLLIDGKMGQLTKLRIRHCKFWLGYEKRDLKVDAAFLERLKHPKSRKRATLAVVKRGIQRRVAERHRWRKLKRKARRAHGVTTYDGVPVAAWMVSRLNWARAHGWRGRLVSGWRSPEYSESLCYRMCGAPKCPGRCAGRSTNHVGVEEPNGALDVSDYEVFGDCMRRCPLEPRLSNHLPNDRVHYSVTGN